MRIIKFVQIDAYRLNNKYPFLLLATIDTMAIIQTTIRGYNLITAYAGIKTIF